MEKKLTVIIADEEEFCAQLAEAVQKNENFSVIGQAHDGEQATNMVMEQQPDILVLDMMLTKREGIAVLKSMENMEKKPAVIATSAFVTNYVAATAANLGVRYLMLKPYSVETLIERMEEITCLADSPVSDDVLEAFVINAIHDTGIPANILGYEYLLEALKIVVRDKSKIRDITKEIYVPVAEQFDATPSRVSKAIARAIVIGWDRGDLATLESYFGYRASNAKGWPANSEYIALVAEKIRLRLSANEPMPRFADVEKSINETVAKVLKSLGVPEHIKGYQYLRQALIIMVEDQNYYGRSGSVTPTITKVIYPEVARIFNTTAERVQRAMSHAIEVAWDRGDLKTLQHFFGYTINNTKGKPTNSEFLTIITKHICVAMKKQRTKKD